MAVDAEILQKDEELNLEINSCFENTATKKTLNFIAYHKKEPIYRGSRNIIFRFPCMRFSPNNKNENGTLIFKGFFKKSLCRLV